MQKALTVLLIISILVIGGLGAMSCSKTELQGVEVELDDISPIFGGKESIALNIVFSLYNPNDYQVTLDELYYDIRTEDTKLAEAHLSDDVYLPAETTVKVSSACVVTFANMVGELMIVYGKSQMEATMAVLPIWKGLGGLLVSDALQTVWDGLEDETLVYDAEGNTNTVSDDKEIRTSFSVTWSS